MIVKLLTEHHFEFLSLKGDCTGLSESTHVKMPHCWKSCVAPHLLQSMSIILIGSRYKNSLPPGNCFMLFCCLLFFFILKSTFQKILSGIPSECQPDRRVSNRLEADSQHVN